MNLHEYSHINQTHSYKRDYKTVNQADNFELFVAVESRVALRQSCVVWRNGYIVDNDIMRQTQLGFLGFFGVPERPTDYGQHVNYGTSPDYNENAT